MARDNNHETQSREETLLEGRNAVLEYLKTQRQVDKIFLAEGARNADVQSIAKTRGIPVVLCDRRKLDRMSVTGNHQGMIAQVAAAEYVSLEEILQCASEKDEAPLLVICDGIEDPHNLGAIIRSAEALGAHGVVIPKRRAVGLTATVARTAAGALSHIGVHKTTNMASFIDEIKAKGIWVFGAEADGETPLHQVDFDRPMALVIGSEGQGLSRLVREKCDYTLTIPMRGRVNSLNASNAAAIMLFEVLRCRTLAQ